ncbi:MAG: hypothetical protein A2857_01350 [Candidatus Levybacteria bacterium RIFCSPHIGHO2_01_FULL_36_15]|nr:MAG: hypothetical protein A2857_01350 [Candidatus Levybacteria bacterium RIFCSPHIGHO2_01_FULL_36_15]
MKNKLMIFFLITAFFVMLYKAGHAATVTSENQDSALILPTKTKLPSATPEDTPITPSELDKIQKIKEMVASKVAELKLVEKRGVAGHVQETSTNQITVSDINNKRRIMDIDELTKFQGNSSSSKSFGISDLKSGDLISTVGLYNKETKRLLARFVYLTKTLPVQFEGVVTDKDEIEYTLIVKSQSGETKTIDIESSTKTKSYSQENELVKSGFSKIDISDKLLITGFYDLKDKNLIIADRIVILTYLFNLNKNITPTPDKAQLSPALKAQ